MTDIKFAPRSTGSPLFLRDEELKLGVDLMLFAMRDLNTGGDDLLRHAALGRAHGRALYMIGRRPGLSVTDLLSLLRVTKQSLNRVLGNLLKQAYVEQRPSAQDRRKRLLYLTEKGQALHNALWEAQRGRIAKAFREAGPDGVAGFRKVLSGLVDANHIPHAEAAR